MKFTLQQLRYVTKIIKKGSLSEAAKELSITQAGLSLSISQLESELGADLFERVGRGVVPTEAGRRLAALSQKTLAGAHEIEQEFMHRASKKEWLNIGAMRNSLVEIPLLSFLDSRRGQLSWFGLEMCPPSVIYREVGERIKSMGIAYTTRMFESNRKRSFDETNVRSISICRLPFSVFLAVDHPLANKELLTEKDLEPYPYFAFDQYMFHRTRGPLGTHHNPIEKSGDTLIVHPVSDMNDLVGEIALVDGYTRWACIANNVLNPVNVRAIREDSDRTIEFFCVKHRDDRLTAVEEDFLHHYATWLQSAC